MIDKHVDMQNGHAAWTCNVDMQQGQACGQAELSCSMDMQCGHAGTCSIDIQPGCMEREHGYEAWTQAASLWSIGMQNGRVKMEMHVACWTSNVDTKNGY